VNGRDPCVRTFTAPSITTDTPLRAPNLYCPASPPAPWHIGYAPKSTPRLHSPLRKDQQQGLLQEFTPGIQNTDTQRHALRRHLNFLRVNRRELLRVEESSA